MNIETRFHKMILILMKIWLYKINWCSEGNLFKVYIKLINLDLFAGYDKQCDISFMEWYIYLLPLLIIY